MKFITFKYRIRSTATPREGRGIKSYRGEHTIDWIGYADDLESYFEDVANLQKGITLLNDTFNRYHLQINAHYRYINSNEETYPENIVKLCDEDVDNVKVFWYLGDDIKFNQPSTGDTEIDLRTSVAENKFSQIARTLCNRNTILEARVYILIVMVRSRLTYSCQTWNINQEQMNRVIILHSEHVEKDDKRWLQTKSGN